MAQEITVTASLSGTKPTPATASSILASITSQTIRPTMSGSNYMHATESVATSDETIGVNDVATAGWCFFRNLDGTNYIEIGNDGTNYPVRLKAGEFACFRFNGAIHAKANTAAAVLEYLILED